MAVTEYWHHWFGGIRSGGSATRNGGRRWTLFGIVKVNLRN
jgi:hypothetical protein